MTMEIWRDGDSYDIAAGKLESLMESQIASRGFGNVSEYVRSLLREAQAKEHDDRLQELLLEGLTSGKGEVWLQKSSGTT